MIRSAFRRIADHPAVQARPYLPEFAKFGTVGFVNTLLDYSIYAFLTRFVPFFGIGDRYLIANVLSFSVAVTNSFVWNRRWTFRHREGAAVVQFPKFILVNLLGLGLNELTLFLLVRHAGLHDLIAKVLAIGVSMVSNFLLSRFWVFRRPVVKS